MSLHLNRGVLPRHMPPCCQISPQNKQHSHPPPLGRDALVNHARQIIKIERVKMPMHIQTSREEHAPQVTIHLRYPPLHLLGLHSCFLQKQIDRTPPYTFYAVSKARSEVRRRKDR